jgi:hypothetical protein
VVGPADLDGHERGVYVAANRRGPWISYQIWSVICATLNEIDEAGAKLLVKMRALVFEGLTPRTNMQHSKMSL